MNTIKEKHTVVDYIYWNVLGLIPLLLACFVIYPYSRAWTIIYLLIFAGHFLILEYRFFCTHCPHYCNETQTTQCMFLWGIPKFFKKRPRALRRFDIAMLMLGLAITVFFPLYWLVKSWQLCTLYFLSWALLIITMRRYECTRCTYFHCPANSVEENVKKEYLKKTANT